MGPQRSLVVSAPACKAEAFGIESRWLHIEVVPAASVDGLMWTSRASGGVC